MTAMRGPGGRIAVGIVALLVATLGPACGSDGEKEAKTSGGDRTSSTLILPDTGPAAGFSGPVAVIGYDTTTGVLVVVRGAPPDTRITVDERTAITVQGDDGPEPLPVEELASWLTRRKSELPGGDGLVPMRVEAEGEGNEVHASALAEIPPG